MIYQTVLAVTRLKLAFSTVTMFFCWRSSIWAQKCRRESTVRRNTMNILFRLCRSHVWMSLADVLCWEFGSETQALNIFWFSPSTLPSRFPPVCTSFSRLALLFSKKKASVWSVNFRRHFLQCPPLCAWHFWHRVSNLCSVPVSGGSEAVVFPMTPSTSLLTPFISMCVPSLCVSSRTVKGSLSGWIRAGCPSRRRRPRDNARCLWWVVNMTLCLQRLTVSYLHLCKADLTHSPLCRKLKAKSLLCSVFTIIQCDANVCLLVSLVRTWEAAICEKMSTLLYTS